MTEPITEAVEGATVQEGEVVSLNIPATVTISEQVQPEPAPVALPAERVAELVRVTNLPEVSKARLLREYADEADVESAIAAEVAYVKELTGSGKPFAQGGGTVDQVPLTEAQKTERFNQHMREIGAREV